MFLVVTGATIGLFASVQPAYANSLCGTTIKTSITLTSDLSCSTGTTKPAIRIGANGITLNCNGHVIQNTGSIEDGIVLVKRSHVTVENCHVENFAFNDIVLYLSSHNTVEDNVVSGAGAGHCSGGGCYSGLAGIQMEDSSSNTVTGNVASSNYYEGFTVFNYGTKTSSSNTFSDNLAVSNVLYGFIDLTSGSGTAGTANTYTSNICVDSTNNGGGAPSSPVGLC